MRETTVCVQETHTATEQSPVTAPLLLSTDFLTFLVTADVKYLLNLMFGITSNIVLELMTAGGLKTEDTWSEKEQQEDLIV